MKNCLLIDFDGTIGDTNKLVMSTIKSTAKSCLDIDVNDAQIIPMLGKPLIEQMEYFIPKHKSNKELSAEMVSYYRDYYNSHRDEMMKPYPYLNQMINAVRNMGIKTAIVSSKGPNGINHGLHSFGIADKIDVIVSSRDVVNHKPHPEPVLKALSLLDAGSEESIMLGDSPMDMESAIRAGVSTALVSWNLFPKERFKDIKIDYIINSLMDVPKLFTD